MSRLLPSGKITGSKLDGSKTDSPKATGSLALFNLAFRPFFLFGALFSLIAVLLWSMSISGEIQYDFYGGQLWWHIHEMLFGFIAAIIIGFLLTAVQSWSGVSGLSGTKLIALFTLWLVARIVMFLPNLLEQWIIASIDILFLPTAAIALAYPIVKTKLWRNLMFVPILLAMTTANIYLHKAVISVQPELLHSASNTMIFLIVLIMCILGGRVFPMFTANGTNTKRIDAILMIELLSILSIVMVLVMNLLPLEVDPKLSSTIYFFSALVNAIRAARWRIWVTFKTPLVWSLHISYWCIVIGLLLLGLTEITDWTTRSQALHTLTIGAMSGMILSMISRVSLGHTGRAITVGKIITFALVAIFAAFLMRVFGLLLIPDYIQVIYLTALFWCFAYGSFVWVYLPILTSARADGKPG